jgi:hypothetical protein
LEETYKPQTEPIQVTGATSQTQSHARALVLKTYLKDLAFWHSLKRALNSVEQLRQQLHLFMELTDS